MSNQEPQPEHALDGVKLMHACFVWLHKDQSGATWYQPTVWVPRGDPGKPVEGAAFLFCFEVEAFAVAYPYEVVVRLIGPDGKPVVARRRKGLSCQMVKDEAWGTSVGTLSLTDCPPLEAGTHTAKLYIEGKVMAEARLAVG